MERFLLLLFHNLDYCLCNIKNPTCNKFWASQWISDMCCEHRNTDTQAPKVLLDVLRGQR